MSKKSKKISRSDKLHKVAKKKSVSFKPHKEIEKESVSLKPHQEIEKEFSFTPNFTKSDDRDLKYDAFLKGQTKYLDDHPDDRYTFDKFLHNFNKHRNIHSPNHKMSIETLKSDYFDLIIQRFKQNAIDFILANPTVEYNKALLETQLQRSNDRNDITLDRYNFTNRDLGKLYNEIIDESSKFTFGKKTLGEKSTLTKEKANYTRFKTRYNNLENEFIRYRQNAHKKLAQWTKVKKSVDDFINNPINIFDPTILTTLGEDVDYNTRLDKLTQALEYLNTAGVPKDIPVKEIVKKVNTRSNKKVIKEVVEEVMNDIPADYPIAEQENIAVAVVDNIVNPKFDYDKAEAQILALNKKIDNARGAVKKHIPKWKAQIAEIIASQNIAIEQDNSNFDDEFDDNNIIEHSTPLKKGDESNIEYFELPDYEDKQDLLYTPPGKKDKSVFESSTVKKGKKKEVKIDLPSEFDESYILNLSDRIATIKDNVRNLRRDTIDATKDLRKYEKIKDELEQEDIVNTLDETGRDEYERASYEIIEAQNEIRNIEQEKNKLINELEQKEMLLKEVNKKLTGKGFHEIDLDELIDEIIMEEMQLHGEGFGDFIKNAYKRVRNVFTNEYSPQTERAVKQYGDYDVTNVALYRTPVEQKALLNILTFGQFAENYAKHYDDVYHLFGIFEMTDKNGKKYYSLTEKIPTIQWEKRSDLSTKAKNAQRLDYTFAKPINFRMMIETAMKNSKPLDSFWKYKADSWNCQHYLLTLIDAGAELAGSPTPMKVKDFIYQDPEILFKGLDKSRGLANFVTDLGHKFGRVGEIVTGGKKHRKNRRRIRGGDINQDIVDYGVGALNLTKNIPIVGKISNYIAEPISDIVQHFVPKNTLSSALQSKEDKYANLFKDDQYLYDKNGNYLYPKETQDKYLEGQKEELEHGFSQKYKDIFKNLTNQEHYDLLQISRAHNH